MRYKLVIVAVVLLASIAGQHAQAQFAGTSEPNNINGAALPKPPAGNKVALVVFEDLGCPFCAFAHPMEIAAAQKSHIPILRYDFPLAQHVWTFQGAVCARYLQDKVDPKLADQYRADVFASQQRISNKDDLAQFTQVWMQRHGKQMPFVLDPDGKLAKEVQADFDLGERIHVDRTPTVVVVTDRKYQVICGTHGSHDDPKNILPAIEGALTQTHTATTSANHFTKQAKS